MDTDLYQRIIGGFQEDLEGDDLEVKKVIGNEQVEAWSVGRKGSQNYCSVVFEKGEKGLFITADQYAPRSPSCHRDDIEEAQRLFSAIDSWIFTHSENDPRRGKRTIDTTLFKK
ncbi:hypothetical protein ACFL0X_01685 [Nanoarchaeota archaeon]